MAVPLFKILHIFVSLISGKKEIKIKTNKINQIKGNLDNTPFRK